MISHIMRQTPFDPFDLKSLTDLLKSGLELHAPLCRHQHQCPLLLHNTSRCPDLPAVTDLASGRDTFTLHIYIPHTKDGTQAGWLSTVPCPTEVARWLLSDFKIVCVWPFGLMDYGSATLRCKI